MAEQHADRDFVEYLIKQIVNNPDDVVITRKTDEMGVLLEVKVNPNDMGLLIGRAGTTAKAIRILTRIIGMRNNARVNLRIIEPEGSLRQNPTEPISAPRRSDTSVPVEDSSGKSRDIEDVVDDMRL
ncbi:MAG: hypothetical protein A3A33_00850 [Candidatus Yanofskybacteria bacterium RIFCSPLOWO2_01_FULL_49_25]|uniref:RNA-binding protein KhpA n=1 Tax=Candidatus Yanofskybacteria bacterium RIFCSPLOWO2_01_FULL_49_25 TaxID=1802701 RepID=A0A1F8GWP6_9BACT|nr:MAG: hypothetical protein A3A33_00850 [Candidatus Yanofskybacteria bacterium RIFCSPLOWO2_01_FULL_49_25]